MKRDIKFKGFDNFQKRWLYSDQLNKRNDINIWISNDYVKHISCVFQHTGLKDKNGIEIYEGDIVTLHSNKMIVKKGYHLIDSVFELKGFELQEIYGYYLESFCGSHNLNLGYATKYFDINVISNIYENKK